MEHATFTLAEAAAAGILLIIAADKLRVPSIVLLLLGGVLLGPQVTGLIDPGHLGHGLEAIIGLAVAVVLFEGGLTLDFAGYRRAPRAIRRMLTVGVLITWLGTALAVWLILGWSFEFSLVAGSLIIVTGPTVISPLLRRMHVRERVHHVLYWEGVLIDAVGVFVAVLCFEWLSAPEGEVVQPVVAFLLRVLVGVGFGVLAGWAIAVSLARRLVDDAHANIFTLAAVVLVFGGANELMHESGILAVVTAGLVVALRRPRQLARVRAFKLELTELAIGVLFILLSAQLDLSNFAALGGGLVAVLAVVLFVLRPLNIFVSTWGQGFERNEKLLLSWLAPRGIVAASLASLFALRLEALGYAHAAHLETLTYAVIGTTVALQGLSAPAVARLLGVAERPRRTWLLLGPRPLTVALTRGLRRAGVRALSLVSDGVEGGPPGEPGGSTLIALSAVEDPGDDPRLADVDQVLIAHADPAARLAAARVWAPRVGGQRVLTWTPHGAPDAIREESAGTPVFETLPDPGEVASALASGELTVHVCETEPGDEQPGRFGGTLRPLFWVEGEIATVVPDPTRPGPPAGHHVVLLKRKVRGLEGLIAEVTITTQPRPTMRSVILRLLEIVAADYPDLSVDSVLDGILARESSMSSAVGGGIAIPHAYFSGVDRSRCYLAVVEHGVETSSPDAVPVRLVCLVISPPDQAKAHLTSLAALVEVFSDDGFRDLVLRQRTPDRVRRLLAERS